MSEEDTVASWWQGVKPLISSWSEGFESIAGCVFEKTHLAFREFFSQEQDLYDRIEMFVSQIFYLN